MAEIKNQLTINIGLTSKKVYSVIFRFQFTSYSEQYNQKLKYSKLGT